MQKEGNARVRSKIIHFNNLKFLQKESTQPPATDELDQEIYQEEHTGEDFECELLAISMPETSDVQVTSCSLPEEGGENDGHHVDIDFGSDKEISEEMRKIIKDIAVLRKLMRVTVVKTVQLWNDLMRKPLGNQPN